MTMKMMLLVLGVVGLASMPAEVRTAQYKPAHVRAACECPPPGPDILLVTPTRPSTLVLAGDCALLHLRPCKRLRRPPREAFSPRPCDWAERCCTAT